MLVNGVVDFCVFGAVASIQNVENSAVEGSYKVNPLVPSGFFWPFFHFFSLKERVPLNQFLGRDHLNDR